MAISYSSFEKWDTEQTFTNTVTPTEKVRHTFTTPASGNYLILVSVNLANSLNTTSTLFQAKLDGSTTISDSRYEPVIAGTVAEYRCFASLYLASALSGAEHYVQILAAVSAASTGYMKQLKILVIRLDDALPTTGMYGYNSSEGSTTITAAANVFQDIVTLAITPDVTGDYLILGSCQADPNSTTASLDVRLNINAGAEVLPVSSTEESAYNHITAEAKDANDWYDWLWGGIVSLDSGAERTIVLQAERSSTNTAAVRNNRILAVRLAALGTVTSNEVVTNASTTNTDYSVDKAIISWTPSADDFIILGGIVEKPDGTTVSTKTRLEHKSGTSPGTISEMFHRSKDAATPADAVPLFSFEKKTLTAIAQAIAVQPSNVAAATMYSKAAFVIAIPLVTDTTAYKDVSLKATLESQPKHKDISLKTTIESQPQYKDITLKASMDALNLRDIALRSSLDEMDYKDLSLKTSLDEIAYYDILLNASFDALIYKDVLLRSTLESQPSYKEILLKASLEAYLATAYKDISLRASLESSPQYKDVSLRTSIESLPQYKDLVLKTSLDQRAYEDIVLKASLDSLRYNDLALKASLEGGQFKDVSLRTSIESQPAHSDVSLGTNLDAETFKDLSLRTSLDSGAFADVGLRCSICIAETTEYVDAILKASLDALAISDIALKTSLESSSIYKDVSLSASIDALAFCDLSLRTSTDIGQFSDILLKASLVATRPRVAASHYKSPARVYSYIHTQRRGESHVSKYR